MSFFFFFKQKTAYEMRISDWSSDVCSSDLPGMPLDLPQCITRGAIEGERRLEQPREVERLAHPPPRLPRPSERVRPIGCKPRLQSAIADIETDSASLPRRRQQGIEAIGIEGKNLKIGRAHV